jgi:hypothetical protein
MTTRIVKLQILGPIAVLLGAGAAEAAAWGLAQMPNSETLWFLNLKVFAIFQKGHYVLNPLVHIPYSQLLLVAVPLFALAAYGYFGQRSFILAVASNLSFVYAAFLLLLGMVPDAPAHAASLASIAIPAGPKLFLPLALVAASLVSFFVSHFQYLFAVISSRSISQA